MARFSLVLGLQCALLVAGSPTTASAADGKNYPGHFLPLALAEQYAEVQVRGVTRQFAGRDEALRAELTSRLRVAAPHPEPTFPQAPPTSAFPPEGPDTADPPMGRKP